MREKQKLLITLLIAIVQPSLAGHWYEGSRRHRENVMAAGYDRNKQPLHVCRASLWGRKQLGISRKNENYCRIPYAGKVYTVERFSLLKKSQGYWQPFKGRYPKLAISLGQAVKKKPQLLCRVFYRGALLPGKTWPAYNRCDVVINNHAQSFSRFSVFVNVSRSVTG